MGGPSGLNGWQVIHDDSSDALKSGEYGEPLSVFLMHEQPERLPGPQARVFLYLDDARTKAMLPVALERDWEVAPLPHPDNGLTQRRFRLDGEPAQARDHAVAAQPVAMRLLTCNGIPVYASVVAGKWFSREIFDGHLSRWAVFRALLRKIRTLQPFKIVVGTVKGQNLTTAGVGFVVAAGPGHSYLGEDLRNLNLFDDARSTLIVVAPRSSLELFALLARLLLLGTVRAESLPSSLGLIRSRKSSVTVDRGIDYVVDGTVMSARTIDLECSEQPLRVRPGRRFPAQEGFVAANKDAARVQQLPTGDSVQMLSEKPLPFFNHATEDEFRDLFLALKESAVTSSSFLALMAMSSLLALFGLYANSAPVIIGAMILAPLMGPIISLSMGLARSQIMLIRESLKTLAAGIGLALFFGMVVSSWIPIRTLTAEMAARLTPNLLDLGVAVVSGMAGAYANAREEVAKSLAGVAIAVALVPPLCVVGIGLGWMDAAVIQGASLLFITNLVGIAVAASLTFLALGFAPFRMARKGLVWSVSLFAIVSIPLYFAFEKVLEENGIMDTLSDPGVIHYLEDATISPLSVQLGGETLIRIQITSRDPVTGHDLERVRNLFTVRLGRPVTVETLMVLRR